MIEHDKLMIILYILTIIGFTYIVYRLLTRKSYDLDQDQFRSTNVQRCLRCGVQITNENDSGYEAFVDATHTQAECKSCFDKDTLDLSQSKVCDCGIITNKSPCPNCGKE